MSKSRADGLIRARYTDENPGVIAKAVTTLGHSFGMEITAEGVETGDQLAFLRSLGCDEMQGYFFSRPLPDEELEIFLKNYEETWALKDVSFTIPKGSMTALVGRSGAGKSTLVDLIPRLRDAKMGTVRMDGVPILTRWIGGMRLAG